MSEHTHPEGGEAPGEESDEQVEDREYTLQRELEELRAELDELEGQVQDKTVHREDLESDLQRYVRKRMRRGHARGWGPYLVLLYGTAMTIGAFYFLGGGWAILAMGVVWLSTLGLYVMMLMVGAVLKLLSLPGGLKDVVAERRS